MHASARRHSANADGLLQTSQHLLPPVQAKDSSKKCVVIDLDETLVHSSFKVIAKDSRCDVTLLINSLDLFETRPGYISLHVIPVVHVSRRDCYCCAFSTNSLITTCFLFTWYSYDVLCWRDVYCAHWPRLFLSAAGPHSTSTSYMYTLIPPKSPASDAFARRRRRRATCDVNHRFHWF